MKQALLTITGSVQGVFYRANARDKALELGLSGYCENMSNGSVEAMVQGDEEPINKFIAWAKEGPPSASVGNIEIDWQEPASNMEGFQIN